MKTKRVLSEAQKDIKRQLLSFWEHSCNALWVKNGQDDYLNWYLARIDGIIPEHESLREGDLVLAKRRTEYYYAIPKIDIFQSRTCQIYTIDSTNPIHFLEDEEW